MVIKRIFSTMVVTLGLVALLVPSAAFAYSINNSMVISPDDLRENNGACCFQASTYTNDDWFSSFDSDFRTELNYQWCYLSNNWETAVGTFGIWHNEWCPSPYVGGPEYLYGWVWWTETSTFTCYYGDTFRYLETNIYADGPTNSWEPNVHGQTLSKQTPGDFLTNAFYAGTADYVYTRVF